MDLLSTERARCARLASEALTDALRASYAKEVDEIDSGVIASCKSHDPESLAVYLPVLEEKGMRHAGVIYRHQGLDKDICLLVASDDYYDEIDAAKVAMHLLAEMREFEPSEWEQVVRFRNGALKLGGGYADQLRFFFLMRAVAFPGQR
ncbi:MAG: hypothetical protein DWQ42_03465 [Planctomycetota bacterium]|nr:MAG: hypothetical protein DWQ42_03465 [Planctomycetota bacterium]